ncbi:MAG: hypothetical protein M3541_11685 [Acidobacteriota bacterium]|nr:hypothetical protein [Acidobacteriota bacterium]MDQ3419421.1 hypothetical protein [Acidobacteriota bacterium]
MPAGNARRLGYGEFDQPNLLFTRHTATCKFLTAVTQRYPVVLEELSRIPVDSDTFGEMVLHLPPDGGIIEMPPWKGAASRDRLVAELQTWAARHHISTPFVLNAAAFTLYRWHIAADPSGQWAFPSGTMRLLPSTVEPTTPEPLHENWPTALARWRELWDARITELERAGYPRSLLKDEAHLDWVARMAVGGETITHIARDVHRARSGVSDAVHAAADLLKLSLPRSPRSTSRR